MTTVADSRAEGSTMSPVPTTPREEISLLVTSGEVHQAILAYMGSHQDAMTRLAVGELYDGLLSRVAQGPREELRTLEEVLLYPLSIEGFEKTSVLQQRAQARLRAIMFDLADLIAKEITAMEVAGLLLVTRDDRGRPTLLRRSAVLPR